MMICMPSRMWFVTEITVRMRSSAISGRETVATAWSQGRKARLATMMTKATMRGMFETAVMRWSHQCSAPWPAAPSPFARASGVRIETRCRACCRPWSLSSAHGEGDDPDQDRERHRGVEREARHGEALARPHAVAEIPDEVAHPAEHVVDERPGVAEQDQETEPGAEEPFHLVIGARPRGHRHEPDGHERGPEIVRRPGDAVDDRHRHRPAQ